jgi:hypothetical protein
MSNWRERAQAVRLAAERRLGGEAVVARTRELAPAPHQGAFARQVIQEVLLPVLTEVVGLLTGSPGKPLLHEYGPRDLGVSCELDSLRFQVHVFLLEGKAIRVAVSLLPSFRDGCFAYYRDFGPQTGYGEIEAWFGDALVKMYENH